MSWDKLPTHDEWSTAKKGCGADKILRDEWHIGEHLEKYHKLGKDKGFDRYYALVDLHSKFTRYKDALTTKDKAKACTDLLNKMVKVINYAKTKQGKILQKFPDLKKYVDLQAAKAKIIYSAVEVGKEFDT